MLTVDIDLSAINAQIDGIKAKAEAAIRPAAQAGAQVYYEAVLASTPVSKAGHWFHGTSFKKTGRKYWFESGSLKKAVYQVYSKDSSSQTHAEYQVAWNHRKVPYGFMVALGTTHSAANNFIAGPRQSVEQTAKAAMAAEFQRRLAE